MQPACWFCLSPAPIRLYISILGFVLCEASSPSIHIPDRLIHALKNCLYQKLKIFGKINQNSKDRPMVIMASLLVRNVENFELQRESSQRDLKILSKYRNFRITEIRIKERKLYKFLKEISR